MNFYSFISLQTLLITISKGTQFHLKVILCPLNYKKVLKNQYMLIKIFIIGGLYIIMYKSHSNIQ